LLSPEYCSVAVLNLKVAVMVYIDDVVIVAYQKPQEHSSMCRKSAHEGYLFLMEKSEYVELASVVIVLLPLAS